MSGGATMAFRGALGHFIADPDARGEAAFEFFEDGLLVVRDGLVESLGPAPAALARLAPGIPCTDYSGRFILPGFIDAHVHYAQTDIIASHGAALLEWLERYTFPAEMRFGDRGHAEETAAFFLDELLRNGTTTAMVFATVHAASVDALCAAAAARGMRLLTGKVMMDRNCPEGLRDSAEESYRDSEALIARWHGRERLLYAVTPRFAPTSTEAQLRACAALLVAHGDLHLQSHVAETRAEVAWVAKLFPGARSYLDVYDRFGLLRERAVYGHGIYLDEPDRARLAESGAAIAFCPTSNLFLGSGLFDCAAARRQGVALAVGTDVGGGSSFSMLRTLHGGYTVARLGGQDLSVWQALYMATLGGARALRLDDRIGCFRPGREADFVVLDPAATPLLARRMARAETLDERLFALMMLGDDRSVAATHVLGRCAYRRAGETGA